MDKRPFVLSIAGFDPSGGAGILADIKTFEANGVMGLGVCSALTFQNDAEFDGLQWVNLETIYQQTEVLLRRFDVRYVKIGLIQSLEVLQELVNWLQQSRPGIQIVWDPILKASAGFVFHEAVAQDKLVAVLAGLALITPNLQEIRQFLPEKEAEAAAEYLSQYCAVLLKGGHADGKQANDVLFEQQGQTVFAGTRVKGDKHGTGCVLSACITAAMAKGSTLPQACAIGKQYITDFIRSNDTLLGYHHG